MKVAIVGAGISGLCSAYYLRKLCREADFPLELVLFESSPRPGGVFDTVAEGETVIELGPDSFITYKPWALELVKDLGLEDSLVGVGRGRGKNTFVYHDEKLYALPEGFFLMAPSKLLPFLRSDLFTLGAKLRVLLEPLVPRGSASDESVRSFVVRRFGREIFEKAAQPLIGGIYMSDPEKLGLSATVPQFLEMEKRAGSVLRELLRNPPTTGGESGARYGLFLTLRRGMSSIIEKLCSKAEFSRQNFKTSVSSIEKSRTGWLVGSGSEKEEFDAVILSVRADAAGALLSNVDLNIASKLSEIAYIPSVATTFVFREKEFSGMPDGLGIIIPATAKMNLVACSLYSRKFPDKCESDKVVLRCFLGGDSNPDAVLWDEERIKAVLREELSRIFGCDNRPIRTYVRRYPHGMPRLVVGHKRNVSDIMNKVSHHSGLGLCGAAYLGVGIPDCVRCAELAAGKIYSDMVSAREATGV